MIFELIINGMLQVAWGILTFIGVKGYLPFKTFNTLLLFRVVIILPLLYFVYHKVWKSSQSNKVRFFDYSVPLLSLNYFFVIMASGLVLNFLVPDQWRVVTNGVMFGAIFEELLARSLFLQIKRFPHFMVASINHHRIICNFQR